MLKKALIVLSLILTAGILFYDSAHTRPGRMDANGRLLAYLYRAPDGLFVNLEIVRQGYGKVHTVFPFKHKTLFQVSAMTGQHFKRRSSTSWNSSKTVHKSCYIMSD